VPPNAGRLAVASIAMTRIRFDEAWVRWGFGRAFVGRMAGRFQLHRPRYSQHAARNVTSRVNSEIGIAEWTSAF